MAKRGERTNKQKEHKVSSPPIAKLQVIKNKMEDVIKNIQEYGVVGFLGYYFIREAFGFMKTKKNGNGTVEKQDSSQNECIGRIDERLKVIETNHLPHIQKGLEKNAEDHQNILVAIAEIKILIREKI